MMAQTNNMIFFSSVCPLVSLIASPKQPQSFIGLAHTNHMVNNVMMTINAKQTREISLRRMAKRRNTPMQNSRLDITTEASKVIQSGIVPCKLMAAK